MTEITVFTIGFTEITVFTPSLTAKADKCIVKVKHLQMH